MKPILGLMDLQHFGATEPYFSILLLLFIHAKRNAHHNIMRLVLMINLFSFKPIFNDIQIKSSSDTASEPLPVSGPLKQKSNLKHIKNVQVAASLCSFYISAHFKWN